MTWGKKCVLLLRRNSHYKNRRPHNPLIFIMLTPYLKISSLWASCHIRKIAGCACAGNAGNVFPHRRLQKKPLVSDLGMHHGTCVTHVPWCISGSLTRGGGGNVPGIPSACATRNFTYLVRGPCWDEDTILQCYAIPSTAIMTYASLVAIIRNTTLVPCF